ncbi:MAG: hypothetical protein ACI4QR_06770 [Eubacteriales bacterium]
MKKSVYSLVLSDDVISEIDRLAYINNTNRSNMINQILAEYVSMTTPEKRISSLFEELAEKLFSGETFRELAPPTQSVMSLRSALSYKYNPTVRYAVEIYREPKDAEGEIRVSMRTQNPSLISEALRFYTLWANTEALYGYNGNESYKDGMFRRTIIVRKSPISRLPANENITFGDMIAEYISLFDTAMKAYFADSVSAPQRINAMYRDYLVQNGSII